MTFEELVELRPVVDAWAGTDCAMAMWATAPRLDVAIELGKAWGWRYVTIPWVWVKAKTTVLERELLLPLSETIQGLEVIPAKGKQAARLKIPLEVTVAELFAAYIRLGMGFHTSIQTELVLLFKRGQPGAFEKRMLPQVLISPRREHSRKPDEIRTALEVAYPGRRRLEVFARETVDGWESFGNETQKFGHIARDLAQIEGQGALFTTTTKGAAHG